MGLEPVCFFFNPNIYPAEEYQKRLEGWRTVCEQKGVESHLVECEVYIHQVGENRCYHCYEIRLGATAKKAAELGIKRFTTTLAISPYQNHDQIKQVGARHPGFFYIDFRDIFRDSQAQSREMGIYRQRYCGCGPSIGEAEESRRQAKLTRMKKKLVIRDMR